MSTSISRGKQVLFSALITLFALALVFVILELGFARYYSEEESANWVRFHAVRGWALAPGDYWVKPLHRLTRFTLRINEFGLRSHTVSAERRRGQAVVVLGDSFTFAKETASERMFTQRLQVLMDEKYGDVEVINAGVPAYGTAQQLLLMTELSRKHQLNSKMYVLMFFTNDILDNLCLSYGDLTPQTVRPCFVLDEGGQPVLARYPDMRLDHAGDTLVAAQPPRRGLKTLAVARGLAEDWLQTQPRLVRMLTDLGVNARVARVPGIVNGWYRDDVVARGVPLTAALIREIDRRARQHGGELRVSMVPSPFQVYPDTYVPLLRRSFEGTPLVDAFADDPLRPQRIVRQICEEAGIPFQDLLAPFREHNDTTLFIPRDGHLNDNGHRLVAENLVDFIAGER